MKKILKILGNQAVDPADQNIIDTLRKEVKTERLKDRENTGFDHSLISHITSADQKKYSIQNTIVRPKLIFAFGCTSMIVLCLLLNPFPQLKLLIPGEREKLERQMQVLDEVKETQQQIEASLHSLTEMLAQRSALNLKKEWVASIPGYQALLSLAEVRDEFIQVSPIDILQKPHINDFKFLYQKELNLLRETFLKKDTES